jgi:methylase of polypeptide subunit release factors
MSRQITLAKPSDIKLLSEFKEFLLRNYFSTFYAQSNLDGYFVVPFPTRKAITHNHISLLYEKLFFRASKVSIKDFEIVFGDISNKLLQSQLFGITEKNQVFSYYRLLYIQNLLLAVPYRKYIDERVYIGADSFSLARNVLLPEKKGKITVLDLFTGSGIQLFLLKHRIKEAMGIDKNNNAIACANLNATMNDCSKYSFLKYDIKTTDLASLNRKFDLILANPPILPMPDFVERVKKPHSHGGKDGLEFVRIVLREAQKVIKSNGVINILACSLGNEKSPFFIDEIKNLIKKDKKYRILIIKKIPVELDAYYRSIHKNSLFYKWIEFYIGQKATFWYRFVIQIANSSYIRKNIVLDFSRSDFVTKINVQDIRICIINKEIEEFVSKIINESEEKLSITQLANILFSQYPKKFKHLGEAIHICVSLTKKSSFTPQLERFLW